MGQLVGPETEPFLVEPGWVHGDFISHTLGPTYRLLTYTVDNDDDVRFEHRCDRGDRGVVICAPALQIGNGHTLTRNRRGLPTVRGSISCPDCGTHGFITDGSWVDA